MLILAQLPSFHSLRHINMVSLVLGLIYSACATAASIYIGKPSNRPEKDYSLKSDTTNRIFGIFNAIAIFGTTYASGIIPEIQEHNLAIGSVGLSATRLHFAYDILQCHI
ncbi:hypothetical protein VNO78_14076 [Psophocarpus tetragonolobus]|uniref:Amino acid transporter transmembrane domain-containing protein n=1 Tax=Psophocarpus tetragonolobus TaxID=3891 RepID=A0AAN9SPS1_PSOTE